MKSESAASRVAVTADLHLTTCEKNPERYSALENIFAQILAAGIPTLVIAGDLFDETSGNYSDFEKICNRPENKAIDVLIIPGNHDAQLHGGSLAVENVRILTEPVTLAPAPDAKKLFLLPYKARKTMGEFIAGAASDLPTGNWILVSHGDWVDGLYEPNPLEPGVYMPLTKGDIDRFGPAKVILGHIHKPLDDEIVHYVGSPSPLDISETGHRRFLIVDTVNAVVESRSVESTRLYFNETFVILPLRDETTHIQQQIRERIESWSLQADEIPKVRIKVKVMGYSMDKRALLATVKSALARFEYHNDLDPDLSEVSLATDLNSAEIADRAARWLTALDYRHEFGQIDKETALLQALHVIYRE